MFETASLACDDPWEMLAAVARDPDLDHGFEPGDWIDDTDRFALSDARESVAFFERSGPRSVEGHVRFAVRGRDALELARAMLERVFADLPEIAVVHAFVPHDRPAAKLFLRWLGFDSLGIVAHPWGDGEAFYLHRDQFRGIGK